MSNEKFIKNWSVKRQKGKGRYILFHAFRYLAVLMFINLVLYKYVFDDPTLIDQIGNKEWNKVVSKMAIYIGGSLLISWIEWWSLDKQYERMTNNE